MDPDKKLEKMIRELDPTMSKEKQDSMKTTIKDIRKLLKIKVPKKADGGMMNKNLKPVDKKKNPGLAKLPTDVRNKMGYMKDGGAVKKRRKVSDVEMGSSDALSKLQRELAMKDKYMQDFNINMIKEKQGKKKPQKKAKGGMVLEIGLRPATKSEMKMAKEMKKPIKKAGGGMVRGTGAAITGKGFKGVF